MCARTSEQLQEKLLCPPLGQLPLHVHNMQHMLLVQEPASAPEHPTQGSVHKYFYLQTSVRLAGGLPLKSSLALLLRCCVTYGNVLVLGVPDIPGITRPSRIRVVCKQVGKGNDTVNAWTSSEGRDGVIYMKYSEGSTLAM